MIANPLPFVTNLCAWVGVLRLLRLSNSLPASLLVLIGAELAVGWPLPGRAWQAAAAMWCITAFGYVSNDYFDIAEDRINKPDRPLPAGLLPPTFAAQLAVGLAVSALAISALLGLAEVLVALAVLGLLLLYNLRLKGTPGGGNSLIALLAGGTLITGSVASLGFTVSAITLLWLPAALLTTFVAARELVKTIEDLAGDRVAGKQTLPLRWGTTQVLRLIAGLAGLTLVLSLLPWLWLGYSAAYLVILTLGVSLPLFYTVYSLWQDSSPTRVSRCLALLKGSYFAGLVALILA